MNGSNTEVSQECDWFYVPRESEGSVEFSVFSNKTRRLGLQKKVMVWVQIGPVMSFEGKLVPCPDKCLTSPFQTWSM